MTSIYTQLYLAIQQRIVSIKDTNNNEVMKYTAQDVGQLENYIVSQNGGGKPPVDFPCALIDLAEAKYTDMSDRCQMGTMIVAIRLAFPPMFGTSETTSQKFRQKALQSYELEHAVNQVMHGWAPQSVDVVNELDEVETIDLTNTFGSFSRISASTEQRSDFIRVRTLVYSIGIQDMSLATQYTLVPVTFGWEVSFE